MKKVLFVSLLIVLVLSACTSTPTAVPTIAQVTTAIPTEVTEVPTPEPTPYEPVTVKITGATNMGFAPLFLAEHEGYFEQYGIILEKIQFSRVTEALPLLASGDLDVYSGSLHSGLINMIYQEPDVKVVADRGSILPEECTYHAILVRKDLYDSGVITKPEDLKGQMISASAAGQQGFQLSMYLEGSGITLDDVVFQPLPPASYVDAFANQSVAAIITAEPYITILEKAGNAVVISRMEDLGSFQLSVLAFGKGLTVDRPDVGARFMAAYLLGVKKYNEGKTEENVNILTAATGEERSIIQDTCWLPIKSDGMIDFAAVDVFQKWSVEQKVVDNLVTEEQFWDPSFIEAAEALLLH